MNAYRPVDPATLRRCSKEVLCYATLEWGTLCSLLERMNLPLDQERVKHPSWSQPRFLSAPSSQCHNPSHHYQYHNLPFFHCQHPKSHPPLFHQCPNPPPLLSCYNTYWKAGYLTINQCTTMFRTCLWTFQLKGSQQNGAIVTHYLTWHKFS